MRFLILDVYFNISCWRKKNGKARNMGTNITEQISGDIRKGVNHNSKALELALPFVFFFKTHSLTMRLSNSARHNFMSKLVPHPQLLVAAGFPTILN